MTYLLLCKNHNVSIFIFEGARELQVGAAHTVIRGGRMNSPWVCLNFYHLLLCHYIYHHRVF